jgi:redox-sensitive bicupin YhaK (pirin superfamily)
VYTLEGNIILGKPNDQSIGPNHTVLLGDDDRISAWNTTSGFSHFVLVVGKPLNEEVAQYGPFVMNSNEEFKQAM